MELDRIYNEDCLQGMKRIPDGSVDAIICDLPYGTMKTDHPSEAWKQRTQWHSCTNEGIMMGDFIKSANTFIARTFITYDMAKERQVEVFGYCKGKLFDSYNLKRDIQNYLKRKENYNIQRL